MNCAGTEWEWVQSYYRGTGMGTIKIMQGGEGGQSYYRSAGIKMFPILLSTSQLN